MNDDQEPLQLFDGSPVGTGLLMPSVEDVQESLRAEEYPEAWFLEDKDIEKSLKNDAYKTFRRMRSNLIINQGSIGKCFGPGTLIRMADGSQKPIEDVKTLDEVLTAEGNVKPVLLTMVRRHLGEMIKICVWGHRNLRCTPEHPILTQRGYVEAQALTTDDWVAFPRYAAGTASYIDPMDLITPENPQYTKRQLQHDKGRIYKQIPGKAASFEHRVPVPATIELDEDFGWVVGLFMAEGTSSSTRVEFSLHRKEEITHAARLVSIFKEKFGIDLTVVVRNNQCQVKLYGKAWADLFTVLACRKSKHKRLHPAITAAPLECLRGVLAGWCDGDGLGLKEKNILGGVTISHTLALNMFDIANALGLMPCLETKKPYVNPKEKVKTRQVSYLVKYRIEAKGEMVPRVQIEDGVMWRKLDSIESESYDGWVHNFEVQDDHSYVAESIGVHNCNASAAVTAMHNSRMREGMTGTLFADSHLYMNINRGVDGGSQLIDAMKWLTAKGVSPVNLQVGNRIAKFPLTAYNRKQVAPAMLEAADAASLTFQTWEPYRVPVSSYDHFNRAVASALARDHQIIIALHANNAFMTLDSKGYIRQGQGYGNHALIAHSAKWVGSKDDLVHPDIQNSWGPAKNPDLGRVGGQGWGEDGFGLITMRSLWQCAKTHVFWVYTGSRFNPGAA